MRAAVIDRYGPPEVVTLAELPLPVPGPGEVLVRVRSAAVSSADNRIRSATFPKGFSPFARLAFGVRRPRRPVLGGTFAGEVAALGDGVTALATGDRVCGMTGARLGTHAAYLTIRADKAVPIPAAVSDDDAAGVLFGGTTAWHYLREKAVVTAGARVLVNGASGAIGTNAVQLATLAGATVTGVCSGRNAALVRDLGANEVIDYTTTDLTGRFDIVLDTVGTLDIAHGRTLLTGDGVLLLAVASLGQTVRAFGRVKAGPAPEKPGTMTALLDLIAAGRLRVIQDCVLDLGDIVAAHTRVAGGHKVGNVLVKP